jgi:hypothetical protein
LASFEDIAGDTVETATEKDSDSQAGGAREKSDNGKEQEKKTG